MDENTEQSKRESGLPSRYTENEVTTAASEELTTLKKNALRILAQLIQSFAPRLKLDKKNLDKAIKKQLKDIASEKNKKTKQRLELGLYILQDYKKIAELEAIKIPGSDKEYLTLAEEAGGVTEKISLIEQESAFEKLNEIVKSQAESLSLKEYIHQREKRFRLNTQAILKLPKGGKLTEVLHEDIALTLSRDIFKFNTTKSVMVNYQGRPALFVPFEDIRLLKDFSAGKTLRAGPPKFGKYLHYSTIKPVGEGLQKNQFVEDFGDKLSFIYACSDPDAFGGYNQNKGLKKFKDLYIFDQVVMSKDKLGLDSRLSLQPIRIGFRHTRHEQGRNRTLVEDASFDRKFESVFKLIEKKDEIDEWFNRLIKDFEEGNKVKYSLETLKGGKATLRQRQELLQDTKVIKEAIDRRIRDVFKIFPKLNNKKLSLENMPDPAQKELLKHSLLLEKILNGPSLFTEDGRPYRNPWTNRHKIKVTNIIQNNNSITLFFNKKININYLKEIFTETQLKKILINVSANSIKIPEELLKSITENSLFPENKDEFNPAANYFKNLNLLKDSYQSNNKNSAVSLINQYKKSLETSSHDIQKLRIIKATVVNLDQLINKSKNKGFLMHLSKKLQLDIHQELLKIMKQDVPNLAEAFNAAIKLDRATEFNDILITAIENDFTNNDQFQKYLINCIDCAAQATNYSEGVNQSNLLSSLSQNLKKTIHLSKTNKISMIESAFIAATNLGRKKEFQQVLGKAVLLGFQKDPLFIEYLEFCKDSGSQAPSRKQSNLVQKASKELLNYMQNPYGNTYAALNQKQIVDISSKTPQPEGNSHSSQTQSPHAANDTNVDQQQTEAESSKSFRVR